MQARKQPKKKLAKKEAETKKPEENKDSGKHKPNVVALLQELQSKKGYLSNEDMIALSRKLSIPGVDVYGVATFYSQFKLAKQGKYLLSICRGTACHVRNSEMLLDYLQELLGIKPGQTTNDGKITLECVNCMGACAKAPAMMINDIVYGDLDKEKISKIVGGMK